MGRRINDGRGRLGGRAMGTKNKPQPPVTEWVETLLNKHRSKIERTLTEPTDEAGAPMLAALLVASSLNRAVKAIDGRASTPTPQEPDTNTDAAGL